MCNFRPWVCKRSSRWTPGATCQVCGLGGSVVGPPDERTSERSRGVPDQTDLGPLKVRLGARGPASASHVGLRLYHNMFQSRVAYNGLWTEAFGKFWCRIELVGIGWLRVSDSPRSSKHDGTLIDYAAYARTANTVVQHGMSRRAASLSLRPILESVISAIFRGDQSRQ